MYKINTIQHLPQLITYEHKEEFKKNAYIPKQLNSVL